MEKESESITPDQLAQIRKILDQDNQDDEVAWYDGSTINEIVFIDEFLAERQLRCFNKQLYDMDGHVDDDHVRRTIMERISPYVKTNLYRTTENILNALKIRCYSGYPPLCEDRIHLENGTFFIGGDFSPEKEWTMNRLPVRYNADAPPPERWISFLENLLEPDDILTLQEYLGYCLIPSTRGQVMLLLIGKGGEGKSRIRGVMKEILGNSMNVCSIHKLESNRFCPADQEGKLLFMDDDIRTEALPSTNTIKTIVTSEGTMDLERKGKQSYQGIMYVRLLCLGNGNLKSLHDKSYGFYRRQLILATKERPADRTDDPYLIDKLKKEKEGIFLWCLEGLYRLLGQDYKFTISEQSRSIKDDFIEDENNIISFLQAKDYVRLDKGCNASSRKLYLAYKKWCDDNLEKPMAENTFKHYLKDNQRELGIRYSQNIPSENRKTVRGFFGIIVETNTDNVILN